MVCKSNQVIRLFFMVFLQFSAETGDGRDELLRWIEEGTANDGQQQKKDARG